MEFIRILYHYAKMIYEPGSIVSFHRGILASLKVPSRWKTSRVSNDEGTCISMDSFHPVQGAVREVLSGGDP